MSPSARPVPANPSPTSRCSCFPLTLTQPCLLLGPPRRSRSTIWPPTSGRWGGTCPMLWAPPLRPSSAATSTCAAASCSPLVNTMWQPACFACGGPAACRRCVPVWVPTPGRAPPHRCGQCGGGGGTHPASANAAHAPLLRADDTTDACIRYNTVTNKWEGGIAAMPQGVNHAAAATDGARMYVAGGRDGRNTVGNGFNYMQVRRRPPLCWAGSGVPMRVQRRACAGAAAGDRPSPARHRAPAPPGRLHAGRSVSASRASSLPCPPRRSTTHSPTAGSWASPCPRGAAAPARR